MTGNALYPEAHLTRQTDTSKAPDYRSAFRRDFARIVHSGAFRRLGGKTQLFPTNENAVFRTRLTHSLEVAQIAKGIAAKLNGPGQEYSATPIDTDLVEFAALGHDIGHPPFGHNGEEALHEQMCESGGFEGNAQSLRIIGRLEPKETSNTVANSPQPLATDGKADARVGINATARSLAAIIKYPKEIAVTSAVRGKKTIAKGFYALDGDVFKFVLENVYENKVALAVARTIECNIMDLADDIAYSTYDVEDAFAAGLLDPASIMGAPEEILVAVAAKVSERYMATYKEERALTVQDVLSILKRIFDETFEGFSPNPDGGDIMKSPHRQIPLASTLIREGDYIRTRLTATRVNALVESIVVVKPSAASGNPIYFDVQLDRERYLEMEVLKNLVFETLIKAPDFQIAKYRGMKIVRDIFAAMKGKDGKLLLPRSVQYLMDAWTDDVQRTDRVICDYIASMTDEYVCEIHKRMHSWDPMPVRHTR